MSYWDIMSLLSSLFLGCATALFFSLALYVQVPREKIVFALVGTALLTLSAFKLYVDWRS